MVLRGFVFTYVDALVFNVCFYFWLYFSYACIIASVAKALSLCLEFPLIIITIINYNFYIVSFLTIFSKMRISLLIYKTPLAFYSILIVSVRADFYICQAKGGKDYCSVKFMELIR